MAFKIRGAGFKRLGEWWVVAILSVIGLAVVWGGNLRLGGQIAAAAFFIGAVLRVVWRQERSGGLTVRSMAIDVAILLAFGVGILYASSTVNLTPFD